MKNKLKNIKAIMMDVDGVLTNGKIIFGNNNLELKEFNVRDGLAITIAHQHGFKIGFITSRNSEIVEKRSQELKVDYVCQGVRDKPYKLKEICSTNGIKLEEVCYIGDDLIDIQALKIVGFAATVADAPKEVKTCVSFVSSKNGGNGAVRDIIEHILKAQGKWNLKV